MQLQQLKIKMEMKWEQSIGQQFALTCIKDNYRIYTCIQEPFLKIRLIKINQNNDFEILETLLDCTQNAGILSIHFDYLEEIRYFLRDATHSCISMQTGTLTLIDVEAGHQIQIIKLKLNKIVVDDPVTKDQQKLGLQIGSKYNASSWRETQDNIGDKKNLLHEQNELSKDVKLMNKQIIGLLNSLREEFKECQRQVNQSLQLILVQLYQHSNKPTQQTSQIQKVLIQELAGLNKQISFQKVVSDGLIQKNCLQILYYLQNNKRVEFPFLDCQYQKLQICSPFNQEKHVNKRCEGPKRMSNNLQIGKINSNIPDSEEKHKQKSIIDTKEFEKVIKTDSFFTNIKQKDKPEHRFV